MPLHHLLSTTKLLPLDQAVVSAPCHIVCAILIKVGAWVASEVQALALVAPSPVRLAGRAQRVGDQLVVSTARLVVWSTRWAVRARVPGEVQTLALVAPPPVVLSRSRRPILDEIIVSTACVVVRSARRAHPS